MLVAAMLCLSPLQQHVLAAEVPENMTTQETTTTPEAATTAAQTLPEETPEPIMVSDVTTPPEPTPDMTTPEPTPAPDVTTTPPEVPEEPETPEVTEPAEVENLEKDQTGPEVDAFVGTEITVYCANTKGWYQAPGYTFEIHEGNNKKQQLKEETYEIKSTGDGW